MLRPGSKGPRVAALQSQLNVVGGSAFQLLVTDGIFGPLSDRRTREFQIAPSKKLAADGIVGPLTQGKLNRALLAILSDFSSGRSRHMFAGQAGGSGSETQSGAKSVGLATVTEPRQDALHWARQVEQFWSALPNVHTHTVVQSQQETVNSAAQKIEKAANQAGRNGVLFLSAGHGIAVTSRGRIDEGMFQLAPSGFNVVGNNSFSELVSGKSQVSVFYDVRPPARRGIVVKSDKENDEEEAKKGNQGAKKRLENFNRFIEMGRELRGSGIAGIVLVTCRVASATNFLKRARQLMGVPLLAYRRRVVVQVLASRRTRIFLEGDAQGQRTNNVVGEYFVPSKGAMSNDIIFFP